MDTIETLPILAPAVFTPLTGVQAGRLALLAAGLQQA